MQRGRCSEFTGAVQLREIAIECAEGQVTGFHRNREHEAIGESQRRPTPEMADRLRHRIGILKRQLAMIQQHLDGSRNICRCSPVNRFQHPGRFGENKVRDPGTLLDERLSGGRLPTVIAGQEANEDVRINGVHVAASHADERHL